MAGFPVPLDVQQVTEFDSSGLERTLPALHPKRIAERLFLPYTPPPTEGSVAELEQFLEQARFITEDLEWLLALSHDLFWCQVVFDESLQRCLDSYLQLAPRGSDVPGLPSSPALAEVQSALHRAVFMTFLRMATYKESKEHFLTSSAFKEIIYDNFLFDIPKIMDLCVLFGKGNSHLLHKMIENIFTQQPSYYNDLEEAMPTVSQVFESILERCGLQRESAAAVEPMKLSAHRGPDLSSMDQQELSDLLLYLCDSTSTIYAFLEIFPQACSSFYSHGFLSRLSSFYESAVPELEKAARKTTFDDKGLQMELWLRLSHSCRRMVDTVHLLLHHTCLQPILEGGDNIQKCAEELLHNFTSFLPEKRFLCDYNEQFPIVDDISLLQQALPLIDETRTSYLLQGVQSAVDSVGTRRPEAPAQKREDNLWTLTQQSQKALGQPGEQPRQQEGGQPAAQNSEGPQRKHVCPLSTAEVDSLLSTVRDLLPDLGEGFLLACLEEYDYNSEVVINNILEERLSPSLSSLDRSMPRAPSDPLPEVLDHRSNVFDDDEFDIFRRNEVDMSRIWKGRRKAESAKELLNDKRHIADQRERYRSYDTVVDVVSPEPGDSLVYEDEYDDTYDMNQVGANDLDQDSLLKWRPFTMPQILRQGHKAEEEESEEDAEDEQGHSQNNVQGDQFVQDPAVLRERAEARRAAMQQRRGYRQERPSHVVGQLRGQGQSLETVLDRRKKEANKSRGANHNRRMLADRKKNKGMIPM
ncbi:LOW QUALITY PROTEIN: activating signal cointegrator 1 complex subunit 2 [Boleophthalmus pectinirostris]|uniref:LOW QUALITY PROTEIN: activating signal cointegrator 1 complex subunit 2 n=1 Tax=Boleophthalmus pectinirostris TaxID=150288 RepID=UPI000A1C22DF|nr:LOW QUALITY PROTEIN: activating signal cointegrator 1 complex subunit 2 [Boleophthalmus pectinirostris]